MDLAEVKFKSCFNLAFNIFSSTKGMLIGFSITTTKIKVINNKVSSVYAILTTI